MHVNMYVKTKTAWSKLPNFNKYKKMLQQDPELVTPYTCLHLGPILGNNTPFCSMSELLMHSPIDYDHTVESWNKIFIVPGMGISTKVG